MSEALLRVENLSIGYDAGIGQIQALRAANLEEWPQLAADTTVVSENREAIGACSARGRGFIGS